VSHELVRIRSGELAMRCLETGEVMHPGVGPFKESRELYVRQSRLQERLRERGRERLVVFDVGLGAGSNALAALEPAERAPAGCARLELVSYERDLGALRLALERGVLGLDGDRALAARELLTSGEHRTERCHWRLVCGDILQSLEHERARAELVFWDPFSPRANPELWTVAAFRALRRVAAARSLVITYSASTATRVALLLAGWAVGIGDPIGEKAQTTIAATEVSDLGRPLDAKWLNRVRRPDAKLPPDAPRDCAYELSALSQFENQGQPAG
jgi:queuine tRNA-ribosyltransferase